MREVLRPILAVTPRHDEAVVDVNDVGVREVLLRIETKDIGARRIYLGDVEDHLKVFEGGGAGMRGLRVLLVAIFAIRLVVRVEDEVIRHLIRVLGADLPAAFPVL